MSSKGTWWWPRIFRPNPQLQTTPSYFRVHRLKIHIFKWHPVKLEWMNECVKSMSTLFFLLGLHLLVYLSVSLCKQKNVHLKISAEFANFLFLCCITSKQLKVSAWAVFTVLLLIYPCLLQLIVLLPCVKIYSVF